MNMDYIKCSVAVDRGGSSTDMFQAECSFNNRALV